ncbi:unnamed protein product [Mucor circinelloides]
MVAITCLSYDILICIAGYLTSKELATLSQCSKSMYQLQWVDLLWKQYCHDDFSISYNHPDQTFRQLYLQCVESAKQNKRLPCQHLQQYIDQPIILDDRQQQQLTKLDKCQRCFVSGFENLFVCLSSSCQHQLICDRHARHHARLLHTTQHAVYFKPNMAELFCQICVDWIGGKETDPAEQYHATQITDMWSNYIYTNNDLGRKINHIRSIRQYERHLRWKDTPQYIMNNPAGYCFITSDWMAEWEMFVEGWTTDPPSTMIDQTSLLSSVASSSVIVGTGSDGSDATSPLRLHSTESVMIISKDTWNHLAKHYSVKGQQITEDDLKPEEAYQTILKRIEFWKNRANDINPHQRLMH